MALSIQTYFAWEDEPARYKLNGVQQTNYDSEITFTDASQITISQSGYSVESLYSEHTYPPDILTFNAPTIKITSGEVGNYQYIVFNGNTTLQCEDLANYTGAKMIFNGNVVFDCPISAGRGSTGFEFSNGIVNFNNAEWNTYRYEIVFGNNAKIKIDSNSLNKTLVQCNSITGDITLDIANTIQEGDSFSIYAVDNQLNITDETWDLVPSTDGNITTYTFRTKSSQQKKFRLFYTVNGGNRTLRFLGGVE